MALYSFFPCQANGSSLTFETVDLRDDAEAFVQAVLMLQQHKSAAYVAVWLADRSVCSVPRDVAAIPAAITHGGCPDEASAPAGAGEAS